MIDGKAPSSDPAKNQDPDEIRRRGVLSIFNTLKKEHPKMSIQDRAAAAKSRWYTEVYLPNKAAIDAGTYRAAGGEQVTT